jgi:hypothetical protein
MFDQDLEILMYTLESIQDHYAIIDWEAFVFLRKPGCPDGYVVKYAATGEAFANQIVALHRHSDGEMIRLRAALLRVSRYSHAKDFSHHGVAFEDCDKESCVEARKDLGL